MGEKDAIQHHAEAKTESAPVRPSASVGGQFLKPFFSDRINKQKSGKDQDDAHDNLRNELKSSCVANLLIGVKTDTTFQKPLSTTLLQNGCSIGVIRHRRTLEQSRYYIVVVRFRDLTPIKLAFARIFVIAEVIDVNGAVDFGSVHCGATLPQKVGLF